jgi:hypothetical protein
LAALTQRRAQQRAKSTAALFQLSNNKRCRMQRGGIVAERAANFDCLLARIHSLIRIKDLLQLAAIAAMVTCFVENLKAEDVVFEIGV